MSNIDSKKVFISYSWVVKDRVHQIADKLLSSGIDVVIDIYDLKPGNDKYVFMEQSVNDPTIDYVLIISDRTYTEKANERNSGVGDETIVIAPEVYSDKGSNRFIPIVLEKDSDGNAFLPRYIAGRIYIDLSSEEHYNSEFEKLVRHIYDMPSDRKPALGRPPAYLSESKYDFGELKDIIYASAKSTNRILETEMVEKTIASIKSIVLQPDMDLSLFMDSLDQTQEIRDLIIQYVQQLIKLNASPENFIVKIMEEISNIQTECNLKEQKDLINYQLWELMLSFTSVYVYLEDYGGLYSLLCRSFFIYPTYNPNNRENCDYAQFNRNSYMLRKAYEARGDGRKLSPMADTLMTRCNDGILAKSRLIAADLILFHLYPLLFTSESYWFPQTYVYQDRDTNIALPWPRLDSLNEYNRISPLFGSLPIDKFKEKISHDPYRHKIGYQNSMNYAIWINGYIDHQKVGTKR